MLFFLAWIFFVLIVGKWASAWNRSFWNYAILSFFLSPLIGAAILLLNGRNDMKCPKCAESVKKEAKVCRYCQHVFVEQPNKPIDWNNDF